MKTRENRYLCIMLRITSHIERLLAVHDCVTIPHWGGFVLQTVSATYRQAEHAFVPMCKEIVFNAALQHTDGLLAASYMQTYGVDFRHAQQMIASDVEEMKASLTRYGKLAFGSIGSFSSGGTGCLIFHPGKATVFDADFYGLERFHFPVLPVVTLPEVDQKAEAKKSKADIFYIPVNRRLARSVIASAAAVALFLLVSTPVNDLSRTSYKASIIPTERISVEPVTNISTRDILAVETTDSTEEEATTSLLPGTEAASTEAVEEAAPVSKKMFYVVIASFPTESQANVFISGVSQDEFIHVSTVMRDGQYRVYSDAFDNREAAESQLATVRQNVKYDSAWLFISR